MPVSKEPTSPQQPPAEPSTQEKSTPAEPSAGRAWYFWPLVGLGVIVGVFVVGLVGALAIALLADPDDAAIWVGLIRDIFIIVLALEGMFMGLALIVLVLQVAALVNLLQSEVQPIVDNANKTVSTVRGTAEFVSQNVVEPVAKFGALTAGLGGIARELFGIRRALHQARQNGEKQSEE